MENMIPGRELDAFIHTKVMGESVIRSFSIDSGVTTYISGDRIVPHYSTSIADAWEVVDAIRLKHGKFNFEFSYLLDGLVKVAFDGFVGIAETAPLAICLAALKAVGNGD